MNFNNSMVHFIYELRKRNIDIWQQDNTIKAFIPNNEFLSESEKEFIKLKKQDLLELLSKNKIFSKKDTDKILSGDCNSHYPLSSTQERLWFIEQYENGTNIYNIPRVYKLSSKLEIKVLEKSINYVISRHEILRSYINTDETGSSFLKIDTDFVEFPFHYISVNTRSEFNNLLKEKINYIFDLEKEYPISISFIEFRDNSNKIKEIYINLIFHHIAFDGWSVDIFLKELVETYYAFLDNSTPSLPELEIQYKDFSLWQKIYLTSNTLKDQIDYWKTKLNGYEVLNLPTCFERPEELDYLGKNITFELSDLTSKAIKRIAKQLNVSLYTLLLGGYFVFLNYITNQKDITIGTVIANRSSDQLEKLIGFFVNTLALRAKIEVEHSFTDLIENLSVDIINAKLNQDLPFEKLIDCLNVPSDTSRHPLFQVMFVVNSFDIENSKQVNELFESYSFENNDITAKFDLTTTWDDSGDKLVCNFNYRGSLFSQKKVEEYIKIYQEIVNKICGICEIDSLSNFRVSHLIDHLSSNDQVTTEYLDYPKEKTLFSLFDEQAEITPKAVAVIDAKLDKEFTYRQLAQDVKKLTTVLLQGKKTDSKLIGILSEKGYNHVVSTLSIMKSGHAYLPLHHEWPVNRIDDILIQSAVEVILVSREIYYKGTINNILGQRYQFLIIEDILENENTNDVNVKFPSVSSNEVAYVIFTSGSTGKPKGVTISHRGAVNTIYAVNTKFNISNTDSILALSELSFDLSVYDIFGLLSVGGKIIFPNSDLVKEPSHWIDLIDKYEISLWDTVPQLSNLLAENITRTCLSLRLFLLSGDWIPVKLPQFLLEVCPNAKVISLGGATEGSIWSIWFEIKEVKDSWKSIPYGIAMPNQTMLVLNDSYKNCPPGIIGEIHIGGDGVALNYWGNEEKTNLSFIETKQFGRIYKTGDLGCWNLNGYIEFIGRKDSQIKLHGYRIELDEISHHISKFDGVDDAVSILIDLNGQSKICSYYTGTKQDPSLILQELNLILPEYMLPASIIHLDKMPLTPNGKLDRQQFPEPELLLTHVNYVPPTSDIENKLCMAFSNILNIKEKNIGIHDDFFHSGGDSISSIRLVSFLRKEYDIKISAKNIFTHRTVSKLCEKIELNNINKNVLSEQCINFDTFGLLPIQEWFFSKNFSCINHFNQCFIVRVPRLDLKILRASINLLVKNHDALRLKFKINNEGTFCEYIQYYSEQVQHQIRELDINSIQNSDKTLNTILSDWQSEFDIINGPMWSIGYLFGYGDGSARLHVAIHHLLVDTVSWRILIRDLELIYNSLLNNKELSLGTKGTSYRQWVHLIHQYSLSYKNEESYWQEVIRDSSSNNVIEKQFEIIDQLSFSTISIDEETTNALLYKITKLVNTQVVEVLLTVLGITLHNYTQQNVHHIILEGHGREDIYDNVDITDTLGWFTTMYPFRLEVYKSINWISNLKLIKENLKSIPNKGVGYGALFGYKNQELPKITFNYLGQFDHLENIDDWCIVDEGAGVAVSLKNDDSNIISINASIVERCLQISFKCKFDKSTTNEFAQQFYNLLLELVNSLLRISHNEVTMSDFPSYESYTKISNNNEKYLCLLPPGVGGYECYLGNVVPQLNMNLILFNNFNYFLRQETSLGLDLNYLNFERLAENYVAQLKVAQRTGPYALFGWSFGGVLAFEICKQLLQAGEEVSDLFMVDPYFKVNEAFNVLGRQANIIDAVGSLNIKYDPQPMDELSGVNIVLFKAGKEYEGPNKELFNHYVVNERYNSLDKIIPAKNITLKTINSDHFGWVNDEDIVEQISFSIMNFMGASI